MKTEKPMSDQELRGRLKDLKMQIEKVESNQGGGAWEFAVFAMLFLLTMRGCA